MSDWIREVIGWLTGQTTLCTRTSGEYKEAGEDHASVADAPDGGRGEDDGPADTSGDNAGNRDASFDNGVWHGGQGQEWQWQIMLWLKACTVKMQRMKTGDIEAVDGKYSPAA